MSVKRVKLMNRMEKETNNLQKEAKTYLDAMRGELLTLRISDSADEVAMASAQTRIAETVALFYTADRTSDVSYGWR
jgi:hypothetical protein